MYNVTSEKELITIGEAGENIAESCTIDFNDWIQQYGQGDLRIRAIRAGDKQPYPVSNVTVSDGVATWTYTEADTAIKGYGEVQILYYVGDVLSKSRVWQTYTHRSLSVPGEPPQPYDDWIRQVEESADAFRTETAITRADKVVDYIWINYSSNGESYYYGQIEIGATATSYEPYQGHTITTTLPQTVYGGTLDVVSGVLTVTHVFKTFDGSSDEVWNKYGTGMRFTIEVSDYTSPLASIVDTNIKANYLRTIAKSGQGAAQWVISGGDTDYHVLMVNVGIESITDMRAYLAENPLEVVYPLATPTTITLTPTQIDSLLGSNNVWADSGDVTVEYIADTKLYIQKVIG